MPLDDSLVDWLDQYADWCLPELRVQCQLFDILLDIAHLVILHASRLLNTKSLPALENTVKLTNKMAEEGVYRLMRLKNNKRWHYLQSPTDAERDSLLLLRFQNPVLPYVYTVLEAFDLSLYIGF